MCKDRASTSSKTPRCCHRGVCCWKEKSAIRRRLFSAMVGSNVVAEFYLRAIACRFGSIGDGVDIGGRKKNHIAGAEGMVYAVDGVNSFAAFKEDQFRERMLSGISKCGRSTGKNVIRFTSGNSESRWFRIPDRCNCRPRRNNHHRCR